ncbi:GntR family transcriptional regulator [Streptomyces sp. 11x1]|uniref:GntR family transcriptional regulator n=1 Tax=Streptomyces sp. 11x1 TaxID=3038642 RepID=UPI002931B4CC|nr:GntR family transcriptional regulator [Streptomyces sp. 11x1]WNZ10501.1 GntR family transcriptional regulator [Streptomyces sp. 11x1]
MGEARTGEGGGSKFERVLETLRAGIADGTYPVGSSLPPQRKLVEELDVSRATVQKVLTRLKEEGAIASRQGSGTWVLGAQRVRSGGSAGGGPEGRVTLRSFFDRAFERPEVLLDIHTLTSESLNTHIRLQAERIRDREIAPERVLLRLLLPDPSTPLPYITVKGHSEDGRLRERLCAITRTHTDLLVSALDELRRERLVPRVEVEIRHAKLAPTFKVYLRNRCEVLHGFYEVIERTIVDGGEEVEALDVLGLGATMTHHGKDDGDASSSVAVFVDNAQTWFDSVWKLLTVEGG